MVLRYVWGWVRDVLCCAGCTASAVGVVRALCCLRGIFRSSGLLQKQCWHAEQGYSFWVSLRAAAAPACVLGERRVQNGRKTDPSGDPHS